MYKLNLQQKIPGHNGVKLEFKRPHDKG